jgi:uncharacterized protein
MCMKSLVAILLLAVVVSAGWVTGSGDPLRLLIVTGGHDFDREAFFDMFAGEPGLVVTEAVQGESSEAYERVDLVDFDVVLLYDMVQGITEPQKSGFRSLLERGTGLVVLHHALVSYQDWPQFEEVVGGKYLLEDELRGDVVVPASDYQHDVEIPVHLVDRNHFITLGLTDFTLVDEVYIGFRVHSEVHSLLTTTHEESGKPLAWTRQAGNSRVVGLQLGHGPQAFQDTTFRTILLRSIRWTAGRD